MALHQRQVPASALIMSGCVVCDADDAIVWLDAGLAEWLGLDPTGVIGATIRTIFVPLTTDAESETDDDPRMGRAGAWAASVEGYPHRVQVEQKHLPGLSEGARFYLVVALDEHLAAKLIGAQAQLRTTVDAVVSGFAHEVRNPLAAILTLTELTIRDLRNSYLPVDGLMRIPALVGRVERLIRQALEYSRPLPPIREAISAGYLIQSAMRLVDPRCASSTVEYEPRAFDPLLFVDHHQMEQVICNLLQNACEAGATRIAVTTRALPRAMAAIDFRDNGSGIEEESAPRVFEPFYSSKAHGTGLGLAIARDLARLNGGNLQITENSRDGVVFELTLPVSAGHRVDEVTS